MELLPAHPVPRAKHGGLTDEALVVAYIALHNAKDRRRHVFVHIGFLAEQVQDVRFARQPRKHTGLNLRRVTVNDDVALGRNDTALELAALCATAWEVL